MRIVQAWRTWRAWREKRKLQRKERREENEEQLLIERTGGWSVYKQESIEQEERADAVEVQHQTLKAIFRIANVIEDIPYDTTANPLDLIARHTLLSPKPVHGEFSGVAHVQQQSTEDSYWLDVPWKYSVDKSYQFAPQVYGSKFFDTNLAGGGPNQSPFVGFVYYDRRLRNTITPPSYYRGRKFAGGIETSNPEFAAIIHDGLQELAVPKQVAAGFQTVQRTTQMKEPVRVCILGQIPPFFDSAYIRRVMVDGEKLELTRDNVALALEYAANLVAQIFEGKTYDPAEAMRKARAVRLHTTQLPRPSAG